MVRLTLTMVDPIAEGKSASLKIPPPRNGGVHGKLSGFPVRRPYVRSH